MKNLLGSNITYTKGGSRKGWTGKIISIDNHKVGIEFQNGTLQKYVTSALLLPGETRTSDYPYTGYLKVHTSKNEEYIPSIQFSSKDYLIVNLQTKQIVGNELTLEAAEVFAMEQVQDNKQKNTFVVFKPALVLRVKQPEIETTSLN